MNEIISSTGKRFDAAAETARAAARKADALHKEGLQAAPEPLALSAARLPDLRRRC